MVDRNKLLFFSRDYQAKFFPKLSIKDFDLYHVTLNKRERVIVENLGGKVVGCFEEYLEEYLHDTILEENLINNYSLIGDYSSDRFLGRLDFATRKKILFLEIRFWREILFETSPFAVINEPVAFEISDVLLTECEKANVKYLALASFYFGESFYFLPNPSDGTSFKLNKYTSTMKSKELASKRLTQAQLKMRPIYARVGRNSLAKYFYSQIIVFFSESIKRLNFQNETIRIACYTSTSHIAVMNIRNCIRSVITSNAVYKQLENNLDYMFFPLHFEPEAVVSYCAPKYSNQVRVIERVLQSLPVHQALVVKEHPQQPGILASHSYISLKRRWPNLFFASYNDDPYELLKGSIGVITLGGTLGLEALAWGKPVMCLGNSFYEEFHGVFKPAYDEQINLFNDFILKFSFRVELLQESLAKIYSVLLPGNPFPNQYLFEQANINMVSDSIENYLKGLIANK